MANASLKHFKLEDFSSKGSATDSEGSEDDADETEGPGDLKCEAETELNIAQFVKAESLYNLCEFEHALVTYYRGQHWSKVDLDRYTEV